MPLVKHFAISCFLLVCALVLSAQSYLPSNFIPVYKNGNQLDAAWSGGMNTPQFNTIDLNNDGVLDMVVFDRSDGILSCYINQGTANQVDYIYSPAYNSHFPTTISDWLLMRDFDNDGYIDIFTAVPQVSNIRVFRNTSAQNNNVLTFNLYKDTIYSSYPPRLALYSSKSDIPAIDDVDGDGDLDILTFHIGGTYVEWHKNLSIEQTGGLNGMDFAIQSHCYGHFEEDAFFCSAYINNPPCGPGERSPFPETNRPPHSGSTMLSLDLDGNGLQDLIVGDVGCPTLYALYNTGSSTIAHFSSVEDSFPQNSQKANVISFPATYLLDVNNDGLKDLIVAPNSTTIIEDVRGTQLFINQGNTNIPSFVFQQYGFLNEDIIDNGSGSMPCLFDFNGDGLPDLLIGGFGRYDSLAGYLPNLSLFENIGTAQSPAFEWVTDNYLNLRANLGIPSGNWYKPTAGDLDGDGDQDLILGHSNGQLYYFQNLAGAGNVASFGPVQSNFAGIDVGINSSPQLVDVNQDAKLDLVIGNHRGYIHYFENRGTATVPVFVLVSDTFGLIKVNDFTGQSFSNGYAQPFVVDYDNDNDLDLLIGTFDGPIQVYENISAIPGQAFTRTVNLGGRDFGTYSSIVAAKMDSSKVVFLIGDLRGGLVLLRDTGPLSNSAELQAGMQIDLFPNPAIHELNYAMDAKTKAALQSMAVFDLHGRCVYRQKLDGNEGKLLLNEFPNGMYLIQFSGANTQLVRRFVVAH